MSIESCVDYIVAWQLLESEASTAQHTALVPSLDTIILTQLSIFFYYIMITHRSRKRRCTAGFVRSFWSNVYYTKHQSHRHTGTVHAYAYTTPPAKRYFLLLTYKKMPE